MGEQCCTRYSNAAVEEGDRFPQTIEPGLSAAGLRGLVDSLQQPQVGHLASERADIDRWHTECDLVGLAQSPVATFWWLLTRGAIKRVRECAMLSKAPMVHAEKVRDPNDGRVTGLPCIPTMSVYATS